MLLGVLSKSTSENSFAKGKDSVLEDSSFSGQKFSNKLKDSISPVFLLEVRAKMSRLWYIFQIFNIFQMTSTPIFFMHLVIFPSFWRSKDRPRRKSWTLLHEENNVEKCWKHLHTYRQGSMEDYAFASHSNQKIFFPTVSGFGKILHPGLYFVGGLLQ